MARKVTAGELLDKAEALISEHSSRDAGWDGLEDYYFLEGEKDREKRSQEEGIETVRGPHGTNAVDLICDLLAEATTTITVPAPSERERDKRLADAAERFLAALVAETEQAQGQALTDRSAWLAAMRGCLAGRVLFLEQRLERGEGGEYQTGERCPVAIQIRDPRVVYPSFGTDGLDWVAERWTRTVGDVRRSWGEELLPGRKRTDEVEWTEYWDARQFCYWADGQPVGKPTAGRKGSRAEGPWPHGIGAVPYSFRFARQTGRREPEKRPRPLLKAVETTIDRMDLYDSQEATVVGQYSGDALVVHSESDDFDLDLRPGAVNYMRPGETVEWLRAGRAAMEIGSARARQEAQFERATFPHTMYGADPGRMMAGYALNLLNQAGLVRIRPIIRCVEQLLGDLLGLALLVAERRLAPLMPEGRVEVYALAEQEAEGGKRRVRERVGLDARALDGYHVVEVALSEVLPSDEQANLVLALRARQAGPDRRPLLSWETAVERFKLAASPSEERMRIDRELAWNDPDVAALRQAVLVETVRRELVEELDEMGIDAEAVLAESRSRREREQPAAAPGGVQGPEAGLPPEMLAAAMQGMAPEMAPGMAPGMGPGMGAGAQGLAPLQYGGTR